MNRNIPIAKKIQAELDEASYRVVDQSVLARRIEKYKTIVTILNADEPSHHKINDSEIVKHISSVRRAYSDKYTRILVYKIQIDFINDIIPQMETLFNIRREEALARKAEKCKQYATEKITCPDCGAENIARGYMSRHIHSAAHIYIVEQKELPKYFNTFCEERIRECVGERIKVRELSDVIIPYFRMRFGRIIKNEKIIKELMIQRYGKQANGWHDLEIIYTESTIDNLRPLYNPKDAPSEDSEDSEDGAEEAFDADNS